MSVTLNKNDIVKVNTKEEYIILNEFKCKNIKSNKVIDISYLKGNKIIKIVAVQQEFDI